jgi:hypothetical protein
MFMQPDNQCSIVTTLTTSLLKTLLKMFENYSLLFGPRLLNLSLSNLLRHLKRANGEN